MGKFKKYLLPGFIFQSVTVGGGYGTGAEIKEFFASVGLQGGLMGMVITLIVWAVVAAFCLEFARMFHAYDYGTLMKKLLGKFAYLYDACYWVMLLIVLGVVNATAGAMFTELTGWSQWIGIIALNLWSISLLLRGTEAIEDEYSFWSYLLYAVYAIFLIATFTKFGTQITTELAKAEVRPDWVMKGFQYSFYNLAQIPMFLYAARHIKTRDEAFIAGGLAGLIAIVPGALLLLAMSADMAGVMAAKVPVLVVFKALDMNWLYYAFELVLFATLVETDTGFIKAVLDRIQPVMGKKYTNNVHVAIIIVCSIIGICVSAFGLIGLIAKGYGTICWGFFILFAVPVCTIGAYQIFKHPKNWQVEE